MVCILHELLHLFCTQRVSNGIAGMYAVWVRVCRSRTIARWHLAAICQCHHRHHRYRPLYTHYQQAQTWGHAGARAVRAITVTHSLRTCVYAQISIRRRLNYSWICWLGLFAGALAHDLSVVCGGLEFGRPIHDLFSGTMRLVFHFCIFETTNAYDWVSVRVRNHVRTGAD